MNRRGFLAALGAAPLLWEPGKKLISIPATVKPIRFENGLVWKQFTYTDECQVSLDYFASTVRAQIHRTGGEILGFRNLDPPGEPWMRCRLAVEDGMPMRVIRAYSPSQLRVLNRVDIVADVRRRIEPDATPRVYAAEQPYEKWLEVIT